jgi:hypothetical protein
MSAPAKPSLHAEQLAHWGWHDMRRKSAAQTSSPCRLNIKGRCDHGNCCARWDFKTTELPNE